MCTISDTTASPIQKWRENIDILNAVLRKEASKSVCDTETKSTTDSGFISYVGRVVPLDSAVSLMREVYGLSSTGADFYGEVDAFLDPA